MSAITKFEKANLSALRKDMDTALAAIAEKYGVKFTTGSCKYTEKVATFTVEVALVDEEDEATSKSRENFATYCRTFGLEASDLDAEFESNGARFRLSGISPRRYKFPFDAVCVSGSGKIGGSYKFPDTIKTKIIAARKK